MRQLAQTVPRQTCRREDLIGRPLTSLMPDGLEKNMTVQELADLLAFIRNWRELEKNE